MARRFPVISVNAPDRKQPNVTHSKFNEPTRAQNRRSAHTHSSQSTECRRGDDVEGSRCVKFERTIMLIHMNYITINTRVPINTNECKFVSGRWKCVGIRVKIIVLSQEICSSLSCISLLSVVAASALSAGIIMVGKPSVNP